MSEPYVAEIAVPPTGRSVAVARNFVADLAVEAGWEGIRRVEDLRLVVSELVTNSVQAQPASERGASAGDGEIVLTCRVFEDRIEITIVDQGGGFDVPDPVPPLPPLDSPREGGFGLPLVALMADQAEFTRLDDGIEVRLVMHRDPDATA